MKIDGDTVQGSDNLSIEATATASSEDGANVATNAIDGNGSTRWKSKDNDDEYLQLNLGSTKVINQAVITWEAAYAEKYEIQVSLDGKVTLRYQQNVA